MSSVAVNGQVLTEELWTSEVSRSSTRISNVPKNPFKVTSYKTHAAQSLISTFKATHWTQESSFSSSHLVLVAMSEERHLEQQTLAIIAHDVAVLGCQLWCQQVWADTDLPQVVKRPVVQFEADPRLRADGIKDWRGCRIQDNGLTLLHAEVGLCNKNKFKELVTYRLQLMPWPMPGGNKAHFQGGPSVCSWCPACAASLHLL